ncbi:hypothetical protein [Pseudomonas sp. ML96]|uniref:hypothetical protein n=1 Tax=Pseudomonas sp. ML96 TaxID=1523503 RepID=UPI0005BA1ABD|nr:hypothetical protein [Pseudomonas sp. ML96]
MATLEEQRRAIGAGITQARAATGAAERQAIHDNMVAKRTGRNIQNDLNALAPSPRKQAGLRQLESRGARPATSSPALNTPQPTNQGTGIASPLTEKVGEGGADTRTYYPERTLPTTDGLLVFRVKRTKTITLIDDNAAEVVMELSNVPGA